MVAANIFPGSSKRRLVVLRPEDGPAPPAPEQLARLAEADRMLLSRLLAEPLQYVDHESYHHASAEARLFGGQAVLGLNATYFQEHALPDAASGRASAGQTLSAAEEAWLFQQFNFARMSVARLLSEHRGRPLPCDVLRELLAWAHRAMIARGQLAQANIRLVRAMLGKARLDGLDFNEVFSAASLALLRSIDRFDWSLGFKFSTYACQAILKSIARVAEYTNRYRSRFAVEYDEALVRSDAVDRRHEDQHAARVDELRDILACNRAELDDMEQTVLRQRFALDDPGGDHQPMTLEQVGRMIGVTKERVRQIQNKALRKLRLTLEREMLAA